MTAKKKPTEKAKCQRTSCTNRKRPLHTCPYQAEINGDDKLCNCCDDCRHDCVMEI